MLCCSHLLLLATRQLFVLAKTLFWALIVTTHLFVIDVQFLALSAWVMILIRREQYCSGPFMYQVMLLHHYVCLLHPCGVIEFYGPYVYVVLFCCCVVQGHQFFGYCFMYARLPLSFQALSGALRYFFLFTLIIRPKSLSSLPECLLKEHKTT